MGLLDKDLIRDLKHKDSEVRLEAVKKINDESVLADVINNDSDLFVCLEALQKISDESVLADIIKNHSDSFFRRKALNKISDESVLAYVAKNDSEERIRLEAVKKITDESVLADVAKNVSDGRVRFEAVKKISDESILTEVGKTFYQEAYEIFKKYDVEPENLQNIAAVNTDCSNFTVIARISDIFGSVNKISGMEKEGPHCFIRIKDNTEIRMIIKEEELKHVQIGNYYIMTHIDCGKYNGTKKLRTTSGTTFTPISETDAKKVVSHFPKGFGYPSLRLGYHDYDIYDDFNYCDLYDGFSEAPDYGLYCRDDDSWDYGNI